MSETAAAAGPAIAAGATRPRLPSLIPNGSSEDSSDMEQGYESDTSSVDHVTDHAPGQWCDLDSNGSPEADCKRELRETRQLPHSNSGASAEARPRDRRASNGKRAQGGKRGLSRRRSDQEQHLAFAAETTIMGTPTREGSGGRGGGAPGGV